jgi:hypothetical protein
MRRAGGKRWIRLLDVELDVRFDVEDGRVREMREGREDMELNFESWIEWMDFPFPFVVKIEPWEKEGRGGLTVTGPSFFIVFAFVLRSDFSVLAFIFEEDVERVMLNIEEALRWVFDVDGDVSCFDGVEVGEKKFLSLLLSPDFEERFFPSCILVSLPGAMEKSCVNL